MCERYSFALPKDKTTRRYGVKVTFSLESHYNISPGFQVPVIHDTTPRVLTTATWGIPSKKSKTGKLTSVLHTKDVTQLDTIAPFLNQRCLIPVDGFYIWRQVSKRSRIPFRVTLKWNLPFAFAGVWQQEVDESGIERVACAILTISSNDLLMSYNHQMPVVLPLEEEKDWLLAQENIEDLWRFLKPFPSDRMRIFPVSPLLNQKNLNSATLIEPVQPADQFGNYMLFE